MVQRTISANYTLCRSLKTEAGDLVVGVGCLGMVGILEWNVGNSGECGEGFGAVIGGGLLRTGDV